MGVPEAFGSVSTGPPRLPGPSGGLRIGLFGGSFNPAHEGHVHVAETALRRLQLDWVWWIVARGNPLKESHGDFSTRIASARRIAAHPRMRVTDLERRLGVNYTHDLLKALRSRAPGADFVWIMGADNLAGFHKWGHWSDIARAVPICVVARPKSGPRARLSKFARTFAASQVPETEAQCLPSLRAPAWTYLTAPWHPASSTVLREAADAPSPFHDAMENG